MISRRAFAALVLCLFALSVLSSGAFAANDSSFNQQWGLHRIQAEPAWGPAGSGSGVVVAVVDTGVNFGHPDLAGKSAGELNAIKNKNDTCYSGGGDNNGHGTWVAGIIAANTNNGQGIASVAPGAMILSVKALDCEGRGYLSDVSNAIRMAANHGAKVINLSLGYEIGLLGSLFNSLFGEDEVRDFQAAINEAAGKGATVVAAAGNDSLQSSYSGMENVLVVGATGPGDEESYYSSSGAEIMAPGGNSPPKCSPAPDRCIATTERGGGYASVQGTSFAAPHVSGVAALLISQSAGRSPVDVRSIISGTADPVSAGPRVNAARAVGAPVPSGGGGPGPGAENQGSGDGGLLPGGSNAGSRAARAAEAKAKNSAPAQSSPAAPGAPTTPPEAAAGTIVLGAPQGPPPAVSSSVAGYAEGAGAGGRAERLSEREAGSQSRGWRNAFIAVGVTAIAAGGLFFWKKRYPA